MRDAAITAAITATNNDSHYDLFSAGGQDFIVLALTMGAGSNTNLMRWANEVLRANANRQAIVVTHSLLGPAAWPHPAPWTKEGEQIFPALTNNPNLFLMLCGHRHGEGRRHEVLGNGQSVDVVLSDYQSYTNGGSGFMRLMEFSPRNQTIRVKTFSPWTKQWTTNTDGCFSLAWTGLGASPAQRIAAERTSRSKSLPAIPPAVGADGEVTLRATNVSRITLHALSVSSRNCTESRRGRG